MLSTRTAWDLSANRLSLLLEEARRGGNGILDLTETNPTRAGIPYPEARLLRALADPGSLDYEPAPRGLRSAREAVAGVYAGRGVPVDPENLILCAGTSEAYSWIFKLLADPGDEVLVPRPSYPLFDFLGRLESVSLIPYALTHDASWSIDLASLARRTGPRSRALIVVSPNNPTGSYLKKEELATLSTLCREKGMALVGDEVFAEYPAGPDSHRAGSVLEAEGILCFSLGGLSKLAGLPQLKLGWIAVGGPEAVRRPAVERLETIADVYLSVNTPVQLAAPALLELGGEIRSAIRERVSRNLAMLCRMAEPVPSCRVLAPEGGWSAVLRVPAVMSEEEWVLCLLEQQSVLVHPGYFFDFPSPAYLVLSLLPGAEVFREGVERILAQARERS